MSIRITITFALAFFAPQLFAQSLPQDCGAASQSVARSRADAGDKRAQYVLGVQLTSGKCGTKEPLAGFELLSKSAAQYYPPSMHLVGVIYRREGKVSDAVPFFFGAAQRGFRLAEVDLGFAHAAQGSPVQNDPVAYAWFSLAAAHEAKPELHKLLDAQIAELSSRMTEAERGRAEQLKAKLLAEMGSTPRFNDDP